MITHANLVTTIAGCNQYLESFNETLGPDDAYLSFLPLAHVFDRSAARSRASCGAAWLLCTCCRVRLALSLLCLLHHTGVFAEVGMCAAGSHSA